MDNGLPAEDIDNIKSMFDYQTDKQQSSQVLHRNSIKERGRSLKR